MAGWPAPTVMAGTGLSQALLFWVGVATVTWKVCAAVVWVVGSLAVTVTVLVSPGWALVAFDVNHAVGIDVGERGGSDGDRRDWRGVVERGHGHVGDDLLAGDDLAEDGMQEVEELGRAGGDEELRVVGVGSGVGHGELEGAGECELLNEFVVERKAGLVDAAGAVAVDRAALNDVVGGSGEVVGDAVDDFVGVKAFVDEAFNAGRGQRGEVVEELERDRAAEGGVARSAGGVGDIKSEEFPLRDGCRDVGIAGGDGVGLIHPQTRCRRAALESPKTAARRRRRSAPRRHSRG